MAKTVRVTSAQVLAARDLVEETQARGEEVPSSWIKVANARFTDGSTNPEVMLTSSMRTEQQVPGADEADRRGHDPESPAEIAVAAALAADLAAPSVSPTRPHQAPMSAKKKKKKSKTPNPLQAAKIEYIDYKDVNLLRKFISDRGKIRARRVSGVTVKQQRAIAKALKVAREAAVEPPGRRAN